MKHRKTKKINTNDTNLDGAPLAVKGKHIPWERAISFGQAVHARTELQFKQGGVHVTQPFPRIQEFAGHNVQLLEYISHARQPP